tara:strand:+ start:68 stop:565 length:498 start_codon:yes stop_codon:yes gene_type:complete
MKFYCKWGGVETKQGWLRPKDEKIREWFNSINTDIPLYLVGNVVEKHSPTFDVDIMVYKHQPPLEELSNLFTECIRKGFEHELLIDIAYISEWYSIPFKPFYKIRPDKEFYKEYLGGIYHTVYKADKVEQLAPQLWRYDWYEPHSNYFKGLNRGYNFTGIPLNKF